MTPIYGFPGYFITESGQVFSAKRIPIIELKQKINKGYVYVYLCTKSKHTTLKVHRLVAMAFIPNPENKKEVNHKDGDKLNNNVSNLEWCTRSENNLHAYRTGLKVHTEKQRELARNNGKKMVAGVHGKKVINNATGEIFNSVTLAANNLGCKQGTLSRKLSGDRKNNTSMIFYTR